MRIVQSISIDNFRAIEKAELSPKSVNILVGPNNCGKSSILEAIALNTSSKRGFTDTIGNNVWYNLLTQKKYEPRFLVFNGAETASIECDNHRVSIEVVDSGFPQDERGQKIQMFFQNKIEEHFQKGSVISDIQEMYFSNYSKEIKNPVKQTTLFELTDSIEENSENFQNIEMYKTINESFKNYLTNLKSSLMIDITKRKKVIFCDYTGDKLESISVSLFSLNIPTLSRISDNITREFYISTFGIDTIRRMKVIPIIQSSRGKEYQLIVNFEHSNIPAEISRLHDLVISNNKINQSIDRLKERIEYFEDIRKTDKGLQIFLKNQISPLPISSMGDGFSSLIKLTFMNSLVDGGIIILEEPEVSLHPGFIFILCEAILQNSGESQFFISTHSIDFIQALLKVAKWSDRLDDIQVIRMHSRMDTRTPDIEALTGEEAVVEIKEIGRDLRGI